LRASTGPPGIKRGPRQGLAENDFGNSSNAPPYSRDRPGSQATAKLRFYRDITRVVGFGARPVFELLVEIGRENGIEAQISAKVARYASRLSPDLLRVTGGDRMPPLPLHLVEPD
jgi:hypothetical protein